MLVHKVSVAVVLFVPFLPLTSQILCYITKLAKEVRLEGVIFEVITGIITQAIVFWEMTPCSSVNGFCRKLLSPSLILKMEAVDL
jgi:hypothetical protein